ncbi:Clp protease ClpP [Methylorubrum populi]|uniref:head maturation protease, ClpP-related n=1 Tax=Methylorubrum populi TaxID=223967 RepID=UPI0031F9AAE5
MKKLLQLLEANRDRSSFRVKAEDGSDEATIYVYGAIGDYYGIDPQSFVRELAAITASIIHLRINSPGGDVFAARAMKTALEQHAAKVIAHIDGLAASAASFLMLAADEIEISEGAFVMIHQPWTYAVGSADELRASAAVLDKVGLAIVGDYVRRTGKSEEEVLAWMKAETWFTADEAVENGFCDRKAGDAGAAGDPEQEEPAEEPAERDPEAPSASNLFDLSAYRNAPRALKQRKLTPFDALAADRQRAEARLALIERAA